MPGALLTRSLSRILYTLPMNNDDQTNILVGKPAPFKAIRRVPSFPLFCALLRLEERRRTKCNRSHPSTPPETPTHLHHDLLRPSDRRRAQFYQLFLIFTTQGCPA